VTRERLARILDRFAELRIVVVGDFFLDKYLDLDASLTETSLETGLDAYQVAGVRTHPGAAGTVVNNLAALGVGVIRAVGAIGDDGNGYELRRALGRLGVDVGRLIVRPDRVTPTYTKPMLIEGAPPGRELNRLDINNRAPTPPDLEAAIIGNLTAAAAAAHAVMAMDQVEEAGCGAVTAAVRAALAGLGRDRPDIIVYADSRRRIGEFRDVVIKANRGEAAAATGLDDPAQAGRALAARSGRTVFVTLGAEGIVVCDAAASVPVPGVRVEGEIDIVGAGDAASAALVASLAAGASPSEAALVANLTASITIQQLGVTGAASPEQVLARLAAYDQQDPS
jgi:rfaE bifunctional protein kinase chain/domain